MIRYITLLIVLVLAVTGCANLQPLTSQGAKLSDDAVQAAEFTICYGASVGAIRRAFDSPERATLWKSLCDQQSGFSPVP